MEVFVLYIMLPLGIFGADWPVPPSIKCNSTGTFRCINAGNYEDPFDSTCKNYYVCSTYNIDLVQKQETCSGDTWYDPIKEECSSTYKCLCDKDYSFNLCEHCRQCAGSDEETVAVTTSLSDTGTSAATTESASIQPYCSLGGEFNCTQTGRFANPIDFTCRSYYYCYRWQFNGELRFYPYNCSVGLFNPNTGSCDRNYKCPCSVSTEASTSSPVETTNPFITTTSTSIDTTTAISTASTTSPSPYCSVGGVFNCTYTGRYSNPNDLTCRSYYYCYRWQSDGELRWYFYNCSVGLFNPNTGSCDPNYQCPCSVSTEASTSSPVETTNPFITTASTSIDTTRAISTASTTSSSPYCSVGGVFNCTYTGRYSNPNDLTCRSYYYCYRWQSDGELRWYFYNCSVGLFNPNTGSCDPNYQCPCSILTEASTSSPVETTSPFITTTSTSIDTTTAISTASTTSSSPYCSVGGVFNCTYTGRYSNPNDLTCRSYYYCYRWQSNGELRWYFYNCSVGLFNPNTGSCDPNYQCPCSVSTEASTSSPAETTNPFITTTSTSIDTTTAISTAGTTSPSPYCSVGGVFNCTYTGRYSNPNDLTCRSYYYCYRWQSDGELRWYFYNCSVGLFNPNSGSCDPNYQCPCSVSTEASTSSPVETTNPFITTASTSIDTTTAISTASTTSPSPYCSVGGVFNCTYTGRYSNPNDLTCRSYYYCYRWQSDGELRWYFYNCSVGLFNPNTGSCDPNYQCPCSISTEASTSLPVETTSPFITTTSTSIDTTTAISTASTTSPSPYCSVGGVFNCTYTGRYSNPNDLTCRSYYYCYRWQSDGELRWYFYNCSVGLFNPNTGSCDPNYQCPCSVSTEASTSSPVETTNPFITTASTSIDTTTAISTASTTSPSPYCSVGGVFNCTYTGRYSNPNDLTCRSYYYCYRWQSDGELRWYFYNCSVGLFNPNTRSCDPNYQCPCSVSTEASTSSPVETTNPFITTASTSIDTTTAISTASTSSPTPYCSVGGVFNCTNTGRYGNPGDLTCRSYYYCYRWQSDGELRWYFYNCSVGLFNPTTGSCDPNYQCPCSVSTEVSTSSPVEITNSFRTTTSASIDTTITTLNSITTLSSVNTASSSSTSTTVSSQPPYCSEGGVFHCTETGRFTNPNDLTCRSYYYCYRWNSGQLRSYLYNCARGLFNPNSNSCDPNYLCPCAAPLDN